MTYLNHRSGSKSNFTIWTNSNNTAYLPQCVIILHEWSIKTDLKYSNDRNPTGRSISQTAELVQYDLLYNLWAFIIIATEFYESDSNVFNFVRYFKVYILVWSSWSGLLQFLLTFVLTRVVFMNFLLTFHKLIKTKFRHCFVLV